MLPTGFVALDKALGIGGFPRGSIVEIFGPPACGKTALALQCVAYLQRIGSAAVWIDAEHAFDPQFAAQLGVDLPALPIAEPATAEEALEMARRFAASRAVDLVVIDSAAALVPELELEMDLGTSGSSVYGRVLGSALRRLSRLAACTGVCVLFLNQTRTRGESAVGELETSAGGPALKLHSAVRIALAARGRVVRFRLVKNQAGAAYATGELEWRPEAGFVERP